LVNGGTMGVNSLPKTVIQQRRGCDLNPGPTVPESSTLTTRLPSHPEIKDSNNKHGSVRMTRTQFSEFVILCFYSCSVAYFTVCF